MGFMKKLKETFLYTGSNDFNEDDEDIIGTEKKKDIPKPRLDLGNPLRRMKDFKEETMTTIKNNSSNKRPEITKYTKDLIYSSLHLKTERIVGKGKPIEEARLLYKRFLEDKVTDEAMYSEIDLEYIKALVEVIRELKQHHVYINDSKEELITQVVGNKKFLNIVEVMDIYYNLDVMDFLCEHSYIVCGYSYSKDNTFLEDVSTKQVPYFNLELNDSKFSILKEVSSLISNESEYDFKEDYISSKLNPYFNKYMENNEVQLSILKIMIELFKEYEGVEKTTLVKEEVKEVVIEEPNEVKVEEPKEPSVFIPEEEFEIGDDIMEEISKGIEDDVNSVAKLEIEVKFDNEFTQLADPRNPKVSMTELEEAIAYIETETLSGRFELSMQQHKTFVQLQKRLNILQELVNGGD